MKKFLLLIITGTFLQETDAQHSVLNIGDKMPDIYLGKFLNDPLNKLKLSDLKGKLVILDFWNIHCAVCITGMPKMDSLQKKFNKQLQIITVTYNNEKEIENLFSRLPISRPEVPFIIEDTILNKLFPHEGDPLHVWINQEGIISAITFDYNTNNESVGSFLNGIDPKLTRRWDFGFNINYPLVSEQNSPLLNMATNYSVLYKGLDEYSDRHSIRNAGELIQVINADLLRLYKIAYNNELYGFNVNNISLRTNNRIILEVKDLKPFFPPAQEARIASWINKNIYSYELKLPRNKQDKKFLFMRADLNRYLPYKAGIEKRKMKCLALVCIKKNEPLKTRIPSAVPLARSMIDGNSLVLINKPVISLISEIIYSNADFPLPIVDATNFKANIDITIKTSLSDLERLNKELNMSGLALVKTDKIIDILVIRDQ